jgi:hypothetical protein
MGATTANATTLAKTTAGVRVLGAEVGFLPLPFPFLFPSPFLFLFLFLFLFPTLRLTARWVSQYGYPYEDDDRDS